MSDRVEVRINGMVVYDSGATEPPPPPPPPPPTAPGGPNDLTDKAPRVFDFAAGQDQVFTFTVPEFRHVELFVVTASGTYATQVVDSGPGFTDRVNNGPYFSPFRHQGINQALPAGTYSYRVRLNRDGKFMVQVNF